MTNPLKLAPTTKFKKDLKRATKQGKTRELLNNVIKKLQHGEQLPQKNCDHALIGNWKGYRECHITPDWLLIYKVEDEVSLLRLVRTGSHSELLQ